MLHCHSWSSAARFACWGLKTHWHHAVHAGLSGEVGRPAGGLNIHWRHALHAGTEMTRELGRASRSRRWEKTLAAVRKQQAQHAQQGPRLGVATAFGGGPFASPD